MSAYPIRRSRARPDRRASRALAGPLCLLFALAPIACEELLGAEFDRDVRSNGTLGVDGGREDQRDSATDGGGHAREDARADVSIAPVVCGDSRGLQAGAPWPTGGACNTRIGRVVAPPLTNPRIAWRYHLGVGTTKAFLTPPVIAADGTIYAVAFDPPDAGSASYALVAVNGTGTERFRAPLTPMIYTPDKSAPTIAADGAVYVATLGALQAFDGTTGAKKWAAPIGAYGGGSPTILHDGTIVVAGDQLYAFDPASGSVKWQKPPKGRAFTGSVAVLPSGILVVGELPAAGTLDGALQLFTPEGNERQRVTLVREPVTSPIVDGSSRIIVRTTTAHHVFDQFGTSEIVKVGPGFWEPHPVGVLVPPLVWFSAERSRATSLDLSTGAVTTHDDFGGSLSAFAGAGDGTLVWGRHGGTKHQLLGRSPTGTMWTIELEPTTSDPGPAIGADGTVYLPWGEALYAVSD